MNTTELSYKGKVKIKYKVNGKDVVLVKHNEGLTAMFKYLCKILSGNINNITTEGPAYADIRTIYSPSGGGEASLSCLYNLLSLSNREYYFDTTENSWATKYTITLSYTMLNFDVIDEHLTDKFYIYLTSMSGNDFARIKIDENELNLSDIVPGTQAILEWTMLIKNS